MEAAATAGNLECIVIKNALLLRMTSDSMRPLRRGMETLGADAGDRFWVQFRFNSISRGLLRARSNGQDCWSGSVSLWSLTEVGISEVGLANQEQNTRAASLLLFRTRESDKIVITL